MKPLIPLLCCSLLLAQTAVEKARQAVDLLMAGKYNELAERFSPEMKKALTTEMLGQTMGRLQSAGPVKRRLEPELSHAGNMDVVVFPIEYQQVSVNIRITINQAGEVAGLFLQPRTAQAPPYQTAPYSHPGQFRNEEVTVGREWPLPGTLSIPAGKGPFPAVVLVHGSGPNDRDETVLGNKPFRDLAEGLASRGIAVLRYEKRTKQYGTRMTAMDNLTVRQETVDDAVIAAALLRTRSDIDASRVCVLGHSLGGYLVPRIAQADPEIPCFISLAGAARPLEDLIIEQVTYIGSVTGQASSAAYQKQLEETKQVVQKIKDVKPGAAEKAGALLGAGAAYWLDLKGYDPAAEARSMKQRILILQGERDYQVTMTDFSRWKEALGGRRNATFKSYPALNHLFVAGLGKSMPAEYRQPGHVAGAVIEDIASWVREGALPPAQR